MLSAHFSVPSAMNRSLQAENQGSRQGRRHLELNASQSELPDSHLCFQKHNIWDNRGTRSSSDAPEHESPAAWNNQGNNLNQGWIWLITRTTAGITNMTAVSSTRHSFSRPRGGEGTTHCLFSVWYLCHCLKENPHLPMWLTPPLPCFSRLFGR